MQEVLTSISEKILVVSFCCLLLVLFVNRRRTAFEAILFLSCLLTAFQVWFEIKVLGMSGDTLQLEYWYFGFAITDFFHSVVCVAICKKSKLVMDKGTIALLLGFAAAGILQLARYADRIIFETNILAGVYHSGIPTINTMMMVAVISCTVIACWDSVKMFFNRRSV